jgi:hypothetical protein
VRVLLDECVDWRLGRELASHEVKTARQMGWTTLKNGELLALASAQPRMKRGDASGANETDGSRFLFLVAPAKERVKDSVFGWGTGGLEDLADREGLLMRRGATAPGVVVVAAAARAGWPGPLF